MDEVWHKPYSQQALALSTFDRDNAKPFVLLMAYLELSPPPNL